MVFTLKQARLLKGYTQLDVAKHLKVHVQTYARMEKYPDTVKVGEAKSICDLFEMSCDDIFFNTNSTLSGVKKEKVSV